MTDIKTMTYKEIGSGGFSVVYTDEKSIMTYKTSSSLTLESMMSIDIPNVLKIKSQKILEDAIVYMYDFKEKTLMDVDHISTLHIEKLIVAIENLSKLNLVHMDIKPANILFDKDEIYLADLGGLRILNEKDHVKNNLGTYSTVGPENILYKKFTKKSQTWSIGITLLYWATNYTCKSFNNYLFSANENSNQEFFNNFVDKLLPGIKFSRIPIDTKEEYFREFITDCLVIDEKKRKQPYDLITSTMIANNWSKHKSPIISYNLPISAQSIPIKNFNYRYKILTEILAHLDQPIINYVKFCIIMHLSFTTKIQMEDIINLADLLYNDGCIRIENIVNMADELENWQILPGNSIYYSISSKEQLQFLMAEITNNPVCYLLLKPTNKYYTPLTIDLSEF